MLCPFRDPVACCCVLSGVFAQSLNVLKQNWNFHFFFSFFFIKQASKTHRPRKTENLVFDKKNKPKVDKCGHKLYVVYNCVFKALKGFARHEFIIHKSLTWKLFKFVRHKSLWGREYYSVCKVEQWKYYTPSRGYILQCNEVRSGTFCMPAHTTKM